MLTAGMILNDTYKIIGQIGSGGGGIIYKAFHLRMRKYVAVKLIKDSVKSDAFNRSEVDLMKNLKNDYLPQVLDFVEDGSDVYTVMEFVEGKNFRQLIAEGQSFSEAQVKKYALQLCEAVKYLHSQTPPIIHSDIKPANLMLTPKDNICLIDFNISMVSQDGTAMSKGGSRDFGAPEQFMRIINAPFEIDEFREETRFIDEEKTELLLDPPASSFGGGALKTKNTAKAYIDIRTDIYGIGATLYFILTARLPSFQRTDFRGVACSAAMKKAIIKAMDPSPERRFRNTDELAAAISGSGRKKGIIISASAIIAAAAIAVGASALAQGGEHSISDEAAAKPSETVAVAETTTVETTTEVTTTGETSAFPAEDIPESITIKGETYSTSLTELDLSEMGLTDEDIADLKYMTNLERLRLEFNQITDISPLAELTNLTYLFLMGNQITDISPLAGLTELTELNLHGNQITDISPLAGLTNLTELYLYDNQITDISPLAGLTDLTELNLHGNQLTDISPLAGLTNLTELYLYDNQITDISPLAGLTDLTYLYLGGNQITDISPLAGLTDLAYLGLQGNQITGISLLAGLTNLKSLSLHGNQITEKGIEALRQALPNCDIW